MTKTFCVKTHVSSDTLSFGRDTVKRCDLFVMVGLLVATPSSCQTLTKS